MNPITDIALLKHHRVDYSRTIDKEAAAPRKTGHRGSIVSVVVFIALAVIAANPSLV